MTAVLLLAFAGLFIWLWLKPSRPLGVPSATADGEIELRALDLAEASGDYLVAVVGESNYQPELRRVARRGRTFRAVVIPEPTNPYDPCAVRVVAEGGNTIGYLSRETAAEYREAFTLLTHHGYVAACGAKLIGGVGAKRSFGVMLDLKDPDTILTDVRDTLTPGTPVSSRVQPF